MLPFWHKKCLVDNTLVHTSRQVQEKIYFQLLFCIVWKTFVGSGYQQFRFDLDRSRLPIKRYYFVLCILWYCQNCIRICICWEFIQFDIDLLISLISVLLNKRIIRKNDPTKNGQEEEDDFI